MNWKTGDLVIVTSGRVYRIVHVRDAATYHSEEYSAVQIRNGKAYGPSRVITDASIIGPADAEEPRS